MEAQIEALTSKPYRISFKFPGYQNKLDRHSNARTASCVLVVIAAVLLLIATLSSIRHRENTAVFYHLEKLDDFHLQNYRYAPDATVAVHMREEKG